MLLLAVGAALLAQGGLAEPLPTDLSDLPGMAEWLDVWAPPGKSLSSESFTFELSREVPQWKLWVVRESGASYESLSTEEKRRWVLSPDSAFAVRIHPAVDSGGDPMLEPDSDVQLCDYSAGRQTIILYCGTTCDFEIAAWPDEETVLIGSGDWERLCPVIYRLDVHQQTLDVFSTQAGEKETRPEIEWRLWEYRRDATPWIHWFPPTEPRLIDRH